MLIEIHTFRLEGSADERAFLEADRRVQSELSSHHPGLLRRTTARGHDGAWVVVVLWQAEDDADASLARSADHPATAGVSALIDQATVRVQRFETLD